MIQNYFEKEKIVSKFQRDIKQLQVGFLFMRLCVGHSVLHIFPRGARWSSSPSCLKIILESFKQNGGDCGPATHWNASSNQLPLWSPFPLRMYFAHHSVHLNCKDGMKNVAFEWDCDWYYLSISFLLTKYTRCFVKYFKIYPLLCKIIFLKQIRLMNW